MIPSLRCAIAKLESEIATRREEIETTGFELARTRAEVERRTAELQVVDERRAELARDEQRHASEQARLASREKALSTPERPVSEANAEDIILKGLNKLRIDITKPEAKAKPSDPGLLAKLGLDSQKVWGKRGGRSWIQRAGNGKPPVRDSLHWFCFAGCGIHWAQRLGLI